MPFDIIDRNIVEMNCDAIVNSANHLVAVGSGVDYQIYQKAGEQLFKAREKIGVIDYGQAVITDGYNLAAKKIIHTVSPVYDGTNSCKDLLENCYKNSLRLAYQNNCKSIALPLLASVARRHRRVVPRQGLPRVRRLLQRRRSRLGDPLRPRPRL